MKPESKNYPSTNLKQSKNSNFLFPSNLYSIILIIVVITQPRMLIQQICQLFFTVKKMETLSISDKQGMEICENVGQILVEELDSEDVWNRQNSPLTLKKLIPFLA